METTSALLDDLASWLRRYVVLTPEQAVSVSLWVMHSYVYDSSDTSPYLIVSSAEKRSGKTRLLECLNAVVNVPVFTSSMTEASLFRAIDKWSPTLLIDETDALFKNGKRDPSERQEAIRAILNSGYRRGSYTIRCVGVGGKQDVEKFGIYCPKALAGIGHLPDTIRDRGLSIRLQRRNRDEEIEPFRFRTAASEGPVFADRLRSWGAFHEVGLGLAEPAMPEELDDRAQDAYEILVAIADLADAHDRVCAALVQLRGEGEGQEQNTGTQLMEDLSAVIPYLQGKHVATVDLLAMLYEHGENPWEEWWGEASGKRSSMRISRMLREYDLAPEKFRVGERAANVTKRGYEVETLCALIDRYVQSRSEPRNQPANEHKKVGTTTGDGSDLESADLQAGSDGSDLFTPEREPDRLCDSERGSSEWIATASADDLAKWKREVLDT